MVVAKGEGKGEKWIHLVEAKPIARGFGLWNYGEGDWPTVGGGRTWQEREEELEALMMCGGERDGLAGIYRLRRSVAQVGSQRRRATKARLQRREGKNDSADFLAAT